MRVQLLAAEATCLPAARRPIRSRNANAALGLTAAKRLVPIRTVA